MIHELSIIARAKMQINDHAAGGYAGGPGPSRRPRRRLRQAIARVICRLGGQMVSIGRRLECYEVSLIGDPEILRPAKAQIK
jgi:hypothetical protein